MGGCLSLAHNLTCFCHSFLFGIVSLYVAQASLELHHSSVLSFQAVRLQVHATTPTISLAFSNPHYHPCVLCTETETPLSPNQVSVGRTSIKLKNELELVILLLPFPECWHRSQTHTTTSC